MKKPAPRKTKAEVFYETTMGQHSTLSGVLLRLQDAGEMRMFVQGFADFISRQHRLEAFDARKRAEHEVGYATGDGVPLAVRKRWWAKVRIRHPFMPALAERDMTVREMLQAGIDRATDIGLAAKLPN